VVRIVMRWIGVAAAMMAISFPALGAEKLRGVVGYNLRTVNEKLDKAEKLLRAGDAKQAGVYVEAAEVPWNAIHKDYKDRFDPNHPEIVAAKKRMAALRARIDTDGTAVTPPPDPTTPKPGTSEQLDARIAYSLKGITRGLDSAEQALAQQNLEAARTGLGGAETKWKQIEKDFAGQYDPKHPQVVAMLDRMGALKGRVSGLGGKADAMAKVLPVVLGSIIENGGKLDEAIQRAERAFRGFSSLRGDYENGREQNLSKVRTRMDELELLVERVNALLPPAHGAASAFRKQFPNPSELSKLVKSGRQAGQKVRQVEAMSGRWLELLTRETKEALDEAQKGLERYEKELGGAASQGEERQRYVAGNAHKWAVEYAGVLVQVAPTAFPELPEEAKPLLPEMVEARDRFTARAKQLGGRISGVTARVRKIRKDLAGAERLALQRARFPKTAYQGGKWREAESEIRKVWERKITDKKLVKLAIYAPWEVRSEARSRNGRWMVGTYRYISAHCLGRLESGKLYVYRMTFRNTRQPDGSWGRLEHWGVGHVYEILAENIDK